MTITQTLKTFIKNVFSMAILSVIALTGALAFSPVLGNAQGLLPTAKQICTNDSCKFIDPATASKDSLPVFAARIAQFMTFIIGSIAIIFVLYGAFLWLTDTEKGPERGRKIITNAVIALVISVVAFSLVGVLLSFLNSGQL
jgi:hypothetical protein